MNPETLQSPTAHIHTPHLSIAPDGRTSTVTARIDLQGTSVDLWYTFHGMVAEPSPDAFIPAVLLAAMLHGVPLVSEGPVSPLLLSQLPTVQDIYATWVPTLKRIPIEAPSAERTSGPGHGTAAFFTGGIDSFHTFLTHRAEIGTLLFVHGFASPRTGERRDSASRTLQAVGEAFGVRVIEVESNLYRLLDLWLEVRQRGDLSPRFSNFELAHGAAMASVAHLLPDSFGRVYVAASDTYSDLVPWGSHPLLDPLWSTERRRLVHDGCAATRVEKTRTVTGSDRALELLRVCPKAGLTDPPNCGRCEKCLRTMVGLRIVGGLDRCPAFAEKLDLRRVSLTRNTPVADQCLRENLVAAKALGSDPALVAALERALRPRALSRLPLELLNAGWKLTRRILPVEYVNGRIRWRHAG